MNKNCHNSRTSNDTDMKLETQSRLEKGNMMMSKKLKMTSSLQFVTSSLFVRCRTNLPQSGSWIPDAWSIAFNFTLKITSHQTIAENKTRKSYAQLS